MGRDYEIVAYRGTLLSNAELARIVRKAVPSFELYRHSPGRDAWSRRKVAPLRNLHCIAIYEQVAKPSAAVYYSESAFTELRQQAAQPERSLASLVQQAWTKMRADIMRAPRRDVDPALDDDSRDEADIEPRAPSSGDEAGDEANNETLELARALGRKAGEAFWLQRGDHGCVGGFAHFKRGKLVEQASADDVHTKVDDDYVAIPDRKWSAALGVSVTLDDVMKRYFPDRKTPPLRDVTAPAKPIPFDARKFDIALD
jgi:hypothetical protein